MRIKQASARHCFVCGVENSYGLQMHFYQTEPGVIEVNYTVPQHFQGYPGIVHGGILATMLDEIAGRSLMGEDQSNPRFMYTASLNVQYRKPVPVGKPLRIVGRAGKRKTRSATATATVYSKVGELLAEAKLILVDIASEIPRGEELEAVGWRVYPDKE